MPAPSPRVLWVALDACDVDLARRFAAEGDMPNLARTLGSTTAVPTDAPPGVFVSALWPTLFTALDPAVHGYHCWDVHTAGTYDYRHTTPTEIAGIPFWERVSDAGHRVAVLDVPHTRVTRPLDGVHLVEWGCHDRHFGTHAHPPSLLDELEAVVGPHPIGTSPPPRPGQHQFAPCDYAHRAGAHRDDDETEALFRELVDGIERKRAASLALLDREPWSLFMTVLGESHCVGHQLWHLSDPSHPRHDAALAARLGGDPVRQVYRRLDAVLGEHLERADDETVVVVQLSHGMGPHHDGTHLLAPVLERLEAHADRGATTGWRSRLSRAGRALPADLRRGLLTAAAPLVRARVDRSPGAPLHDPSDDLGAASDRLWWLSPNNTVASGVRLNLAGREPSGRIDPAEHRAALEWLRGALLDLVNIDTGRPCVTGVWFTDDVYRRRGGDDFPDLFVEWDRSAPIERVWSPLTGVVARAYDHWRTGDHHREGLLLLRVPGVPAGGAAAPIRTVDIAPTVCATLGVALPGVDGDVRDDLIGALAPERLPVRGPDHPLAPDPARPWRRPARRARAGAAALARAVTGVRLRVDALTHDQADLQRELRHHQERIAELTTTNAELAHRLTRTERQAALFSTTQWVRHAPLRAEPLVSVVTATRDRAHLLAGAMASVQAQTYGNWELIVVDDGSVDATPEVVAATDDPRIRYLRVEAGGCTAARNAGLEVATGELLTYLDDDNRFDPGWLRAVAWAFTEHPEARVAYGARVVDDVDRLLHGEPGGLPWVHFEPWDRPAAERANLVDMNVLAHRREPDLRFHPGTPYFGDWDLLLQLTDDADPLEVPVIAAYYTTSAPDRMSAVLTDEERERQHREVVAALEERRRGERDRTDGDHDDDLVLSD